MKRPMKSRSTNPKAHRICVSLDDNPEFLMLAKKNKSPLDPPIQGAFYFFYIARS